MTTPPYFRSAPDPSVPPERAGGAGWRRTDLLLPALTLRDTALRHNAALFAAWCAQQRVSHAPHAKTHLSPELIALQHEHGAWGMTAATVSQARLLHGFGVRRVILANQVADPNALAWLARTREQDPGYTVMPLVDSVTLVAWMTAHLPRGGARLPVLVELGLPGGRTGARDLATALDVAAAVRASAALTLVGVEGFEGVLPPDRAPDTVARVDAFLADLGTLLTRLDESDAFAGLDEIIFTAGGSGYPDRVARAAHALPPLSRPVRAVVRSGGYLTHEHGPHSGCSPLSAEANHPLGALRPALELWAGVLSTPEPGLAIVGFGKRDASYDVALPRVLGRRRDGVETALPGCVVDRVNDQHAYLLTPTEADLRVGDVVRFGIAHPCTSFDRWPVIPVLGDDDTVIGAVTTHF